MNQVDRNRVDVVVDDRRHVRCRGADRAEQMAACVVCGRDGNLCGVGRSAVETESLRWGSLRRTRPGSVGMVTESISGSGGLDREHVDTPRSCLCMRPAGVRVARRKPHSCRSKPADGADRRANGAANRSREAAGERDRCRRGVRERTFVPGRIAGSSPCQGTGSWAQGLVTVIVRAGIVAAARLNGCAPGTIRPGEQGRRSAILRPYLVIYGTGASRHGRRDLHGQRDSARAGRLMWNRKTIRGPGSGECAAAGRLPRGRRSARRWW